MIYKRFSVFICPLIFFLGLEFIFYLKQDVKLLAILLSILLLLLFIFLKFLIKEKVISRNFWYLSMLPLLFYVLVANFILVLGEGTLSHFVIIAFCIILGIYLENIFLFYYYRIYYEPDSLENSSLFLNILCFFLLSLNLNSLSIFLNLPLWFSSLILAILLVLLLMQQLWVFKIKDLSRYIYLLISVVIVIEFFWVLSFLPANFYVFSIILTILYYFIWGIFRAKLADALDKKIFLRYLFISIALIVIVLLTSSWS
jgi:hypothetical protein